MALILPNTIANGIQIDGDKLGQNFDVITDWANQEAVARDGSVAMTGALLLPGAPTQPNQAATKQYVDAVGLVGEIKMYGGDAAPTDWMLCQGQAISRVDYAALFNVYGIKYGAGDGSTTFNLPDFRGRYAFGYNAGGSYGAVGLGEKFGNKDSTLPAHGHGGVTGVQNQRHSHPINLNSGGQSANHYHAPGTNGNFMTATINPSGVVGQGGAQLAQVVFDPNTGWASGDHYHNVQGGSGYDVENHNHNVTTEGVSPINGNLPPSLSVNFIVKVR